LSNPQRLTIKAATADAHPFIELNVLTSQSDGDAAFSSKSLPDADDFEHTFDGDGFDSPFEPQGRDSDW
jgi:hypothetical protein